MFSMHYARLQLLLIFTLLTAAPAAAQQTSDNGAAGKPALPAAIILDELRDPADGVLIVGGTPAGPNDNRFQVGLLVKNIAANFKAQFCGGSLIASNLVVTAAHCNYHQKTRHGPLIRWQADEVQVLTGTQSLSEGGVRRDVTTIWQHPDYKPDDFDYDVAVWKLGSRAEEIPLARLAISDGTIGSELLVTGWGRISEQGRKSATLLKVSVPIVSHQVCDDGYGSITPRMLCAGFKAGGKDSCRGDSGGPATRGKGDMILTGIVSWGTGCAGADSYGVYTRVSDPEIRDFIRKYLE